MHASPLHGMYYVGRKERKEHTDRSMGNRTTFSLLATERTSRMIVSLMGSSKVETGAKNSFSC